MAALIAVIVTACALFGPRAARAHDTPLSAHALPPILNDVGFDQRLGAVVPRALTFVDEHGARVALGSLFGARPVVLAFSQYRCPNLCPLVLEGLAAGLRQTALRLGADYTLVTVSLDPREDASSASTRKRMIAAGYFPRATREGWRALTGDPASIDRLAGAVGFHYVYDRATDQFAHPTGVVVLTPDGRVARYLFGMDYPARDLRLALTEASGGRIGSLVDHVLLACYRYDVATGRYTPAVMTALRVTAAGTLLGLMTGIALLLRGERRARRAAPNAEAER
jgi:protein SCO1/2